jgi:hypothetical protein
MLEAVAARQGEREMPWATKLARAQARFRPKSRPAGARPGNRPRAGLSRRA